MTLAPTRAPDQLPIRRRTGGGVLFGVIAGVVLFGIWVATLIYMTMRMSLHTGLADQGATWLVAVMVVLLGIVALVPLGFVIWAVLAIDRWEPEPPAMLIAALVWGGTGAIFLTMEFTGWLLDGRILMGFADFGFPGIKLGFGLLDWLEAGGSAVLVQALQPMLPNLNAETAPMFVSAVINAPITEELAKAVPVLVAFIFLRKYFDGPIDGIVLAALAGAGFAYTENIQYFTNTTLEGGILGGAFNFFIRGVMSPLTHAIFTALGIGLALGISARLPTRWWAVALFPVGYAVSVFLHALWNSADFWLPGGMATYFIYYLIVQVPICIAAILLVLLLRRFERRITHIRLAEYATAGWFSREEVERIATSDGRTSLLGWARPRRLKKAMQAYIQTATRLALNRQRVVTGRDKLRPVADESSLLADVAALREHMTMHATGAHARVWQGTSLPAFVGSVPRDQRFAGAWAPQPVYQQQPVGAPAQPTAQASAPSQGQSWQPSAPAASTPPAASAPTHAQPVQPPRP